MAVTLAACAIAVFLQPEASAQSAARPKYQDPRFEENWSAFDPPTDETVDRYDLLKDIELSEQLHVSLGSHARIRLEEWNNFGFGKNNDDAYILYRAFMHSDWRYGEHFRVFIEGKFAASTDRDLPGGIREALDVDDPDFWNTFIEVRGNVGPVELMGRAGRQELKFGKQRLISPLDWANNRRIFDGVRGGVHASDGDWVLDGFWTRPVVIDRDDINEADDEREFAGLYFTKKKLGPIGIDAFLLYLENDILDQDIYTIGTRIFGQTSFGLTYDAEAAFQFGETGSHDNKAWMFAAEIAYTFGEHAWKPWLGAGFDYASGDSDPTDDDVETFIQHFPLGHAYLGYIDIVGRQNIIGIRASAGATVPVSRPVKLKADLHHFWLANDDDALYNAGGGVVRAGGVDENEVGFELDLTASMQLTPHTAVTSGYSAFFPGNFVDDTGDDARVGFFYTQWSYLF